MIAVLQRVSKGYVTINGEVKSTVQKVVQNYQAQVL